MLASEMRIGQPDLTLNETVGRDVRAECACNVRFTRPDAPTSAARDQTAWRALASTRLHVRSSSIGGFLGVAAQHACDRFVVIAKKGARRTGNGQKESQTGKPVRFHCSRSLARSAKLDGNARPTVMIDECRARSLWGKQNGTKEDPLGWSLASEFLMRQSRAKWLRNVSGKSNDQRLLKCYLINILSLIIYSVFSFL